MNEDLLRIRLEERLKQYIGLPNIEVVKNSIFEEIKDEIETNEEKSK